MKKVLLACAAILLCIGIFLIVVSLTYSRAPAGRQLTLGQGTEKTSFKLEEVRTLQQQTRGLSGRSGLEPGTGMLFVYNNAAERCMWMKDMKFNIDIVWVGSDYHISKVASNLSPATYPTSYCAEAQYVIELPAQTAVSYGLKSGQQLTF